MSFEGTTHFNKILKRRIPVYVEVCLMRGHTTSILLRSIGEIEVRCIKDIEDLSWNKWLMKTYTSQWELNLGESGKVLNVPVRL